jgi:hypothetical protein
MEQIQLQLQIAQCARFLHFATRMTALAASLIILPAARTDAVVFPAALVDLHPAVLRVPVHWAAHISAIPLQRRQPAFSPRQPLLQV